MALISTTAITTVICFVLLCLLRDAGYGGPHHDEVIGLLAAGAKEGSFAKMLAEENPPLNHVVNAAEWHRFTHFERAVSFSEIRWDVMHGDKHPPLAFWLMNLWSRLFSSAGYSEVVWLIQLQVILAALILGGTVWRYTHCRHSALLAFSIFLFGNSAVFTSIWVRQYGLFVVCYAALVAVSGELVRQRIPKLQNALLLLTLAVVCLAGMMTQYTFVTMSLPIHVMLLGVLLLQKNWPQFFRVVTGYASAGIVFFLLMPGVIKHASEVSSGQKLESQWMGAVSGISKMVIPLPSSLPAWLFVLAGAGCLLFPLVLAAIACRPGRRTMDDTRPDVRIPLAGMLGAGMLQFVMVAVGLFPGWATGENHMCAFWLLTVLAAVLCLHKFQLRRLKQGLIGVTLCVMLGMQALFTWHCHRILPRVNTSYIQSQPHDLVVIDELARGFVLQITDLVPAEEKVLATDSKQLASRFEDGSLTAYHKILYLPMDGTVREGKAFVIAAAERSGWTVLELPVVHTGMYEAFLFSQSTE